MSIMAWFEAKLGFFTAAGLFVSIIAVGISEHGQKERQAETETQTLIHDQYELCRALDVQRVEHPEISHMLALPADPSSHNNQDRPWTNYELFRRYVGAFVKAGAADAGPAAMEKLYLEEHAVALHVFDIYEQTRLQSDAATEAKDKARKKVLKMLLDYYETQLLRNPRLRFHWQNGGSDLMTSETVAQYDKNVSCCKYPLDFVDDLTPLDAWDPAKQRTTCCVQKANDTPRVAVSSSAKVPVTNGPGNSGR